MHTHADKTQNNKNQQVTSASAKTKSSGESTHQLVDNRPEVLIQRKLQSMALLRPVVQLMEEVKTNDEQIDNPHGAQEDTQQGAAPNLIGQLVEINQEFDDRGLRVDEAVAQQWINTANGDIIQIAGSIVGHQLFHEANHRTFAQYAAQQSGVAFEEILQWVNTTEDRYQFPFDIIANFFLNNDIRGNQAKLDLRALLDNT